MCGKGISEDTNLTDNITCSENGITVNDGVALDCRGYTIRGTGGFSKSVSGVNIQGYDSTETKNCNVQGFKYNIHVYNSADNNNLTNNNVTGGDAGIWIYNSDNNILTNNHVKNANFGIYLEDGSRNNILNNNTADNSNYGIYLNSAGNTNVLVNNTANDNNVDGIQVSRSDYNTLDNNAANRNGVNGITLHETKNNSLNRNTAHNNTQYGFYFDEGDNNTIVYNSACNNQVDIYLDDIYSGSLYNSGDDNTCDTTNNHKDDSSTAACLYTCVGVMLSTTSTTSTSTTSSTTSTTIRVISQNVTLDFPANTSREVNVSGVNISLVVVTSNNVSQANITIASYFGNPTNSSLSVVGLNKFYDIDASSSLKNALQSTLLRLYYTQQEVDSAGLTESQLGLYWFNESLSTWQKLDNNTMSWVYGTGVNTIQDFVWANVTHFSKYTIAQSNPLQTEFIGLITGWNLISLPIITS